MDYHSMKRKELQALCKEHNIPANLANSVLADKLSALLNEKPIPKTRQRTCMKSPVESTDEGEPAELKRQAKKVRFSPNNDLVEYQLRPGEKQKDMVAQTKIRRKSVAKKVNKSVDDNNTTVELNDDSEQIPVKVTRSRVQSSVKEVAITNNEKKKGSRVAKDVEKETVVDKETEVNVGKVTRSKAKGGAVQPEENKRRKSVVKEETETVEETAVARARVTRSKAQTLTADGTVSEANPKKKSGKQVKTEEQNVEPSNVPVRATRSRRQTIKEDIENTVTNNTQTDKKRTRREMKATDSSHVAPVDKQELPKRKSLRTRGVETVVEDEGDKKEVVNKSRVTRSKAPLAKETSGRNKNKASKVEIQQPVEPIKHEGKKNVNRRKSVLQTEKIEEPVKHPARKNTRRKSVAEKATKTVESPTIGKKQSKGLSGNVEDREHVRRSVKDVAENVFEEVTTGTPKSPKRRGTPIKEDRFIESAKGSTRSASRSEGNSVAGTPNSRKRRGTPIIEDLIIEKSTKSSACSASKSERKSVAKKQVESLKKPMSKGRSSAIRSGAIISDISSKKRAKLSDTKQTDFEDHAVISTKEWTPVAKMKNLKLDEVSEPELTPAVVKSGRRFTRSTIKEQPIAEAQLLSPKISKFKHDPAINTAPGRIIRWGVKHDGNAASSFSEKVGKKKQTRQSAHKKPLDDAEVASLKVTEAGPTTDADAIEVQSEVKQLDAQVQMSSHEVAEVGSTSDVSTIGDQSEVKQPLDEVQMSAPEVSEVGVNPDVYTVGVQSEIEQSNDNVQMSSLKVAEVQPNSDGDTTGAESEIFKEVTGQTLGDLSAFESSRLPAIVVEEEENASVEIMEDSGACNEKSVTESLFSEKQLSPLESKSLDAGTTGTPLGENLSHNLMMPVPMADAADSVPVQDQNEKVYGESGVFIEAAGIPLGKNLSDVEMSPVPMADVAETVPVESGLFTEYVNLERSVLKSERHDATEKEMESTESGSTLNGMQTDVMIEEPRVSVGQTVEVDEAVDNRCDPSLQISSVDKNDVTDAGQLYDEDDSASAQENPFSGNDVYDECDNAVSDRVSHLDMTGTPMIGKGNVQDDDFDVSKEHTGSKPPIANINIDIDIVRVLDDNSDVHGESEHDQSVNNDSLSEHNQLTSNDSLAIDVDFGGDNSEPAQNENVPVVDEVLVKSCNKEAEQSLNVAVEDVPCDTVGQSDLVMSKDAPEGDTFVRVDASLDELVVEAKNVVSSILGDTYDLDEGDDGNRQNLSEFDEGFQSNSISSDTRIERTKEEAETGRWNDPTLDDEHATAAACDDVESGKFMKHGSHMKAHEDTTKEETSPISYTKGEPTTNDVNSSQLVGDIGAHESLITQESSPIAYKKEESFVNDTESDILTSKEDDRNKQDTLRSAGTSIDWGDFDFTMDAFEKTASANGSADVEGKGKTDSDFQALARSSVCLTNSVRKLEKDSGNADDGNSNQEVDILKESVNSSDITEVFNWPGSSLKSLLTTPGTSKTSHINDSKANAIRRGNEDNGSSRTAAHQFNHQRDNSPSKDYDGEAQGNAARDPENEILGVPNIEEFSKLFEDEEVDGSIDRLESNTHFESEQFKSSNEAAETSHQDHPSRLKDNSTCKFGKEVTPMTVPKADDDDLAFNTGAKS